MDSEYDRKFEEMKKYIPFLDSMIKRLESNGIPSNPRQAQLNKIRSLRDLLQDKKKRMKMDNLLKCEQVLINLYKKVEQKETIQETKGDSDIQSAKTLSLNQVRNKLKSVASKLNEDTLPEIARASETEEVCVPGSKEPALFQRRPHRKSISPVKLQSNKPTDLSSQSSKRHYTRVLVSPDRSPKRWSDNVNTKSEKLLFSRRSPRKIPLDVSPSYHLKKNKQGQSEDLNITLKVPEETLSSLSTDDILSRIINCSDSDVDITTLRELRSQILGELKHTGVKEDISHLLLKSYKTKNTHTRKEEAEEGELSDSESEAIESIYGNLVVLDKEKSSSTIKTSLENDQSRKIQICLVINSEKGKLLKKSEDANQSKNTNIDISDFESFPIEKKCESAEILPKNYSLSDDKDKIKQAENAGAIRRDTNDGIDEETQTKTQNTCDTVANKLLVYSKDEIEEITQNAGDDCQKSININFYKNSNNMPGCDGSSENSNISTNVKTSIQTYIHLENSSSNTCETTKCSAELKTADANITSGDTVTSNTCTTSDLNPLKDTQQLTDHKVMDCKNSIKSVMNPITIANLPNSPIKENSNYLNRTQDVVDIPLLNLEATKKQDIVSEIDILQALKKEILGETTIALDTDIVTPPLHQPKITKVASAQEIVKNRISIENYKQKSNSSPKTLFHNASNKTFKEDRTKKQSLKLTEKECTRFNVPIKLPLNESSEDDEEDYSSISNDIYSDLAPKSPDHDDFADTGIKPPVIIPSDPIQQPEVSLVTDVDMRKSLNHPGNNMIPFKLNLMNKSNETPPVDKINIVDIYNDHEKQEAQLIDPRKNRRNSLNRDDKFSSFISPEIKPNSNNVLQSTTPLVMSNMKSNKTTGPNMTPLITTPNMTPILLTPNSRSFEMTPSRHAFDNDDYPDGKHVYAPLFPFANNFDKNDTVPKFHQSENDIRKWDEYQNNPLIPRDVDYRKFNCDVYQNEMRQDNFNTSDSIDSYNRLDCPLTPFNSFGRLDCPSTPLPSFGRLDCPPTPSASFGRLDCPSTPLPFGRLDCPPTPLPCFGRLDGPSTPLPSFGRLDCPGTPLPNFGIAEMPMTPVHPFACLDGSATPVHSFGRTEYAQNYPVPNQKYGRPSDPRCNRTSDFDNYSRWEDNNENGYRDRKLSGYKSDRRSFYSSESYRNFEPNTTKNEMKRSRDYRNERYYRDYSGDCEYRTRRSEHRDNETSRHRSRNNRRGRNSENFQTDSKKRYQREQSISRDRSAERDISNSRCKDSSISRTSRKYNQLSVQHSAGPSFTIDTSINRTFQGLDHSNDFNDRRLRAASVGRTIVKNSDNKLGLQKTKPECFDKRRSLSRACSVGREVYVQRCDNLKDIKADLRAFKLINDPKGTEREQDKSSRNENMQDKNKELSHVSNKSNKVFNEDEKYSPRKNYRDPRIRHEPRFVKSYKKNENQRSRDSRKHGIVYSDDNISKGTILGPGCGVKNYKIPKIKRSPEKTLVVQDSKENKVNEDERTNKNKEIKTEGELENLKENQSSIENFKMKNVITETTHTDNTTQNIRNNDVDTISNQGQFDNVPLKTSDDVIKKEMDIVNENSNRRITRSAKISTSEETLLDSPVKRRRKCKKPVIYDSETDSEEKDNFKNETNVKDVPPSLGMTLITKTRTAKHKITHNNENKCNSDLNSSFGDIFSDSIASDPVIDNINALIADLDHDLDASKNIASQSQFTQEISLENMLENITAADNIDHEKCIKVVGDSKQEDNRKYIQTGLPESREHTRNQNMDDKQAYFPDENYTVINKLQLEANKNSYICHDSDQFSASTSNDTKGMETDTDTNEAVVSTTKDELQEQNKPTISMKVHNDKSAAPDSTINSISVNDITGQETVPDSTNESSNDITSSNSISIDRSKDSSPVHSSQAIDQGDTIGKFLSILQDTSKINEFLSLLSEKSSENEKIKKKLEKLREIVLDDEDEEKCDSKTEINNEAEEPNAISTSERRESLRQDIETVVLSAETISELSIEKPVDKIIDNLPHENTHENFESNLNIEVDSCLEDKNINLPAITHVSHNLKDKKTDGLDENQHAQRSQVTATKKIFKGNRKNKRRGLNKGKSTNISSVTKSVLTAKPKEKKPSRELLNLQADIREMFIKDDILGGTTGIRMCRIAKLVDEKTQSPKDENPKPECEPVVRLEKIKKINKSDSNDVFEKTLRKKTNKSKSMEIENKNSSDSSKLRSSAKSLGTDNDPYTFETDYFSESNTNEKRDDSFSEYDSDSADSSKSEKTESLLEVKKKPKRRRRAWQAGVIVPKNKKKKNQTSQSKAVNTTTDKSIEIENNRMIPDPNCFTDKTYCFVRNVSTYSCRLCDYEGSYIVNHYKKQHPHIEIPLSRISSDISREAIKQCDKVNLQSICKLPSNRYVCRFCFKEFYNYKNLLESFFWHIVSVHTGEYKQNCSACTNDAQCPFDLDIPPPPVAQKGQLIGYICGICNYTQISLENLKNHVINRHDKQTEVYTINMSHMSTKAMNSLLKRIQSLNNAEGSEEHRVLRRTRSNMSAENTDDKSDFADDSDACDDASSSNSLHETIKEKENNYFNIQSKITFENDSDTEKILNPTETAVKLEPEIADNAADFEDVSNLNPSHLADNEKDTSKENALNTTSKDIFELPHFKINYTESGSKEYMCCINNENHYKTTLLISFKKHVQIKHSEKWDGYCCICKAIVTPQGEHNFFNCLQHFLELHFDNFPVLETALTEQNIQISANNTKAVNYPKPLLSVRPLSELMSKSSDSEYPTNLSPLPIIESVISLGTTIETNPLTYHDAGVVQVEQKNYLYEEAQAEVMSKKNSIVLDAMMTHEKLVHVFKCAGRFCSFSTDNAEDALQHASIHTRVGGDNALKCAYCDYDTSDNAIELITHVFKTHGYLRYVCGFCFYRAASSRLVNAHIDRIHGDVRHKTVLKTSFTTEPITEKTLLPRVDAVPFYTCNYEEESENACKFKTYTPGKFCEHITSKHKDSTSHKCFMCRETLVSMVELIQHLKTHGLKLYQCAWCVFGADNESELLAHASCKHPFLQPQAYLRIITNKEKKTEYKALPLAQFNESSVATVEISASVTRENPVREAERSVDLEKLIGHTTHFIESMSTGSGDIEGAIKAELRPANENQDTEFRTGTTFEPSTSSEPQALKPPPVVPDSLELLTTSNMEKEKPKTTSRKSSLNTSDMLSEDVIVCLDSDDDVEGVTTLNTTNHSADTSNVAVEVPVETDTKLPLQLLYMCAKCTLISKNGNIFKNHIQSCFPSNVTYINCAFCSFKSSRNKMVSHYSKTHLLKSASVQFHCFICPGVFTTLMQTKEHLKQIHNVKSCNVSSKQLNGQQICIVSESVKKTIAGRKRSMGSGDKVEEPSAKIKKFGPLDIDLLPINPILDYSVNCSLCEFSTKVRLNMVRHLQLHANQQPVPQTAPINPVPHLETNEKHFDKMVNLASSSFRTPDKTNKTDSSAVSVLISAEEAARYPKYVPERQRNTCGAKGCAYISVDENMLKCHWVALHSNSTSFHCVHCPSNQILETSIPLTASRIISHLKMHDVRLYACAQCFYYHYKRQVIEKHLQDIHKGGNVLIVREEINAPSITAAPSVMPTAPAPTMDLKPWQCGLCEFKSLLRPEVVEHCAKFHQSKMQYKCAYCAFRTSNMENITKHQSLSHQGKPAETFYYYYREESLPNLDGLPYWLAQIKKFNIPESRVKTEISDTVVATVTASVPQNQPVTTVDLNIVKQEVDENSEETIEELCKHFGQFCEPNGLKYKCSLCKNVIEDTKEAMQSHLFEELKYRKWGCSICFYKAFHKRGLSEHMLAEHCQNRDPVELQVDTRVETWVTKFLEYQESIIEKSKEKLAEQKVEILKQHPGTYVAPSSQSDTVPSKPSSFSSEKTSVKELEKQFGPLGIAVNSSFCCPKCQDVIKDESIMRDHLEIELNKIRWCCSACPLTFQTYHQAQFHCKTHTGLSSRPVEAPRDPVMRAAWVTAVLDVQRLSMNSDTTLESMEITQSPSPEPDNSLLVVRYAEIVQTPEAQSFNRSTSEDRLIIDEPLRNRKKRITLSCNYCTYKTTSDKFFRGHKLGHYGLSPYTCSYCNLTGSMTVLTKHHKTCHTSYPTKIIETEFPNTDPLTWLKRNQNKIICLTCKSSLIEENVESHTHIHDGIPPEFGKIGEIIVKCTTCSTLHKNVESFLIHNKDQHPDDGNYVFFKLSQNKSSQFTCTYCLLKFTRRKDLKAHIESAHIGEINKETIESPLSLSAQSNDVILLDDEDQQSILETSEPPRRKVARKSTTKLPIIRAVAKKSTTKLPNAVPIQQEYSFYGTRPPSTDDLENVTTQMPFYNSLMPFTYRKLTEVLNIKPRVVINKLSDSGGN